MVKDVGEAERRLKAGSACRGCSSPQLRVGARARLPKFALLAQVLAPYLTGARPRAARPSALQELLAKGVPPSWDAVMEETLAQGQLAAEAAAAAQEAAL